MVELRFVDILGILNHDLRVDEINISLLHDPCFLVSLLQVLVCQPHLLGLQDLVMVCIVDLLLPRRRLVKSLHL